MPIVPDTKDWTWVLERPCPDCGYDASGLAATDVAGAVRANAASWRALLDHPSATVRPTDHQWSALEYACHVRDVYLRFVDRLALMLAVDDPTFENWDQDATARELRYAEQDPTVVVANLEDAGTRLAAAFDAVDGAEWDRTGTRSDGARFTVATLGRYLVHDPVHHVWDVTSGYARLSDAD